MDRLKLNFKEKPTSTGIVGQNIYDIGGESKIRFVVNDADVANALVVKAKVHYQKEWSTLTTFTGSGTFVVNVATYDELQLELTSYNPSGNLEIICSSFDGASGSAIESIGVTTGDTITDATSLAFSSLDGSVIITGDNVAKTIDFSVNPAIAPVTSVNGQVGDVVLDKSSIGLSNVDNTSDADKPISDATQTALDGKVSKTGDSMTGDLTFDFSAGGDTITTQIISDTIQLDYNYTDGSSLKTTISSAIAVFDYTPDGISQNEIIIDAGSGNVSAFTANAPSIPSADAHLTTKKYVDDNKIDITEKGAPNGVAPLDATSKIDAIYLPAYVDDVVEYPNLAAFPPIGSSGIIYVALDTNLTYRWSGSTYIEISPSAVVSVNTKTGIVTLDKTDIGLSNVDNTSDVNKPISSATQTALNAKEDLANKSIDGTLASNSDTLYPSQKAVKTYVDGKEAGLQAQLDASVYYHELHVNFDYTGMISNGSPFAPYKTLQDAVNAAQAQTVGANTAILIHLKKDTVVSENVVISNMPRNLYIQSANTNNNDSSPIKITGSLTISGATTTRVRVKDLQFYNSTGYALVIDDTNGRHMFQNCQFSNGSSAGLVGTGVNFTNAYRNFIEFSDCTIEGTVNIAGTPIAGTSISFYRCRLGYSNLVVNSANVSVGLYDTYGLYGLTHTNGAVAITGMWGVTGFFNSTANLSATNFLSLSNISLQKFDLSFVALNKTGTCLYQLMLVHRGETADVLSGTRVVYGPTATDAGYKMGVSGNWSPAVSNVAGALDQLAANKANVSHTQALSTITQSGATSGQVPTWNGTAWAPATPSPGITDHTLLSNIGTNTHSQIDTHIASTSNPHSVTKSQVGLGNVDNTSDLDKPISTATQTALDGKFDNPTGTVTDYIAGDGSIQPFPTVTTASNLITEVYNKTGSQLNKFQVVYINGGQGNLPAVTLAQANTESTSSKTYGVVQANISNMNNGYVVAQGRIENIDTAVYGGTEGTSLWLSPTIAGAVTITKPSAPNHMVFIGTIIRSHPTQGVVEVKVQNGFELEELHNVAINSGTLGNNQVLKYESATSLWKNKYIGASTDIEETSFTINNNQAIEADITGFTFSSAAVRSFEAEITIVVDAASDYYETFKLYGLNKGGNFDYYVSSMGDNSGVTLSVTSAGQVQYTSNSYAGFVNAIAKFKAKTLNF